MQIKPNPNQKAITTACQLIVISLLTTIHTSRYEKLCDNAHAMRRVMVYSMCYMLIQKLFTHSIDEQVVNCVDTVQPLLASPVEKS